MTDRRLVYRVILICYFRDLISKTSRMTAGRSLCLLPSAVHATRMRLLYVNVAIGQARERF